MTHQGNVTQRAHDAPTMESVRVSCDHDGLSFTALVSVTYSRRQHQGSLDAVISPL